MFKEIFKPKKSKPKQMAFGVSGHYDKDGKPVITGISLVPAVPGLPAVKIIENKN